MKYSADNNNEGWIASHGETYFSAYLLHDVNDEEVRAQYSIVGDLTDEPARSTKVRTYKLYYTNPRKSDEEARPYFMFRGQRIHLDMFMMRRGGR